MYRLAFGAALIAAPVAAEEARQLDAHEHGVGELNIAFEGDKMLMEFHAPGADIVGFEYAAKTDAETTAIDEAIAVLSKPSNLFVLPDAAGCTVIEAAAELEIEDADDDHDAHDHGEEHAEDAHDHGHGDEHAEAEHAKEDGHGHEDHAHDEHGHDDHEDDVAGMHSEFHAEYTMTCADPSAIDQITFAYFDRFPNAEEVEVQVLTSSGAQKFEVERDAGILKLQKLF